MRARYERWQAAILGLLAFVAYASTAPRYVLGGDNGEFCTLFATGGVAHPPGYPLYVLALRAFAGLPVDTPAQGAALATAVLAALSVFALERTARALGASARASGVFAAVYAFSPLAWKLGSSAEVFAPNVLLSLALIAVSSPDAQFRGAKRGAMIALVSGLGLSNHHSIVLLAPVGIYGLFLALREAPHERGRLLAFFVAGTALGLSPYLYLYFRATHTMPNQWSWGDVHDARSLLDHFLRTEYGTTELGLAREAREPTAQNVALGRALLVGLLGLPFLALAGAAIAFVRQRTQRPRAITLAIALAFALAGPVFVSLFNLAPVGLGARIVERFYLLPCALLCLLAALAMESALREWSPVQPWHLAWPIAPLAVQVASVLPQVGEHNRPTVGLYAENVLRTAPENLVILGSGDQRLGGFSYSNQALGLRPDVVYVSARLLLAPWYRKRAVERLGFALPEPNAGTLDLRAVVHTLLASGRPVALTGLLAPGITEGFSTYPLGPLIRVLPPTSPLPDPDTLERENRDLFARMEIEARAPENPESFAGRLHDDYARPWLTLAQVFAARGEEHRATACRDRAFELAPWTRVKP
jgi:hypothetical protein